MTEHFGVGDHPWDMLHKGLREDCTHPDCAWPRAGDWVTGMSDGVERTGELVDPFVPLISTSVGNEYAILGSTMRKPEQGAVYCPHGVKIFEADSSETQNDCAPVSRMVEPWPCTVADCTRERFEAAMEADIQEYWNDMNDLMHTQYE
jgi:hypothetical protein